MKKTGYVLLALLAMASCQNKETFNVEPESDNVFRIFAKLDEDTRVAITDAGKASWQDGDKIALYDGSAFVTFSLTDATTGEFSGPAGTYTGLAVYPADGVYSWSVSSGDLIMNIPSAYTFASGQTSAPMIAKVSSVDDTFYFTPVAGLFKFSFSNVPAGVNAFRFATSEKINGSFNLGDPTPGTTACEVEGAANDGEKAITINIPSGLLASDMVFYVPAPVTTAGRQYSGFTISLTGDAGTYSEVESTKTWELARKQMQRLKNVDCDANLVDKLYIVGNVSNPQWSFDGYSLKKVSHGKYWAAGVPMEFGSEGDCGFRLYTIKDDWNNVFTYKGDGYTSAEIQLAYHDAGGDPPQILPGKYGFSSGMYDLTFDFYTKKLTLTPSQGPDKLYLVGSNFSWGWNFNGTPLTRVDLSHTQYFASDIVMNNGSADPVDYWGFRIYTQSDVWNYLYTYGGGSSDATGIQLYYHDSWGDPAQIFPLEKGFASGTYDISFDVGTMWLTLTKK